MRITLHIFIATACRGVSLADKLPRNLINQTICNGTDSDEIMKKCNRPSDNKNADNKEYQYMSIYKYLLHMYSMLIYFMDK